MMENRIIWQNTLFSDQIEGGYSSPRDGDPNPTMHGITLETLQNARAPRVTTIEDLKRLTLDDAKAIASTNYWSPIQGDRLAGGVDVMVADCSFNSGPRQATKLLQDCLGFTGKDRDGFLGVLTLQAVQEHSPRALIADYHEARLKFLQRLPNWPQNAKGWTNRCTVMRDLALSLAPAESSAIVAAKDETRRNTAAWVATAATGATTIIPAVVDSLPDAKAAYASLAAALGPFSEIFPWLIPVGGACIMLGIIFIKVRSSQMAHNAKLNGAQASIVAAPSAEPLPAT
jgi:lysozyme family protein